MNPRRRQSVSFFIAQGWTPSQAAGIAANLEAESGYRHDAVGDGGQAYGIAQWHPPRQANFAAALGKDIRGSTFEEQLHFVHVELKTTERAAGTALAACATAEQAGAVVSKLYERPADREGEAMKRGVLAERIFREYTPEATETAPEAPPAAPEPPVAVQQPKPPKEARMPILALLAAFGPILAQLIPQIATILKPSEVGQRNLGLAQVALDTITKAAGAANVQEAVEKMQASPELVKTVTEAVVTEPAILQVITLSEDAKAAVERSIVMQTADKPFWYNPLFWITAMFLPMMYVIILAILFGTNSGLNTMGENIKDAPWYTLIGFDQSTRSGLVNLIVGFIFGGVTGVWFGTTATQRSSSTTTTTPTTSTATTSSK